MDESHKLQCNALQKWIAKSGEYVDTKEPCESSGPSEVELAQDHLVVHRAYMVNEKAMQENDVKALEAQGAGILKPSMRPDTQSTALNHAPR